MFKAGGEIDLIKGTKYAHVEIRRPMLEAGALLWKMKSIKISSFFDAIFSAKFCTKAEHTPVTWGVGFLRVGYIAVFVPFIRCQSNKTDVISLNENDHF